RLREKSGGEASECEERALHGRSIYPRSRATCVTVPPRLSFLLPAKLIGGRTMTTPGIRLIIATGLVLCSVTAIVAQEEHPFIEPAEHARGKRAMRMAAQVQTSATTGRWETIDPTMPINPVHVALMHTG